MFSSEGIAHIQSQRLGRVTTMASDAQLDVVSIGFEFDGINFYISGMNPTGIKTSWIV